MSKIFFTHGTSVKEGFESRIPYTCSDVVSDSVEEIHGENVLEKVTNLAQFIDECHRILVKGGKAVFTSPYFANANAWISPLAVRGISEQTLSFADKTWRDNNKFTEIFCTADFEVSANFALLADTDYRNDQVRQFWMQRYLNIVQAIVYTLVKR